MRVKLLLILSTLFLLTACGDGKQTISQSPEKKEQVHSEVSGTTDNDSVEAQGNLEILQSGSNVWKDSIDTVWINSAAIYKNTGEVPVKIGETQMTYKAKDGSVLGTSTMIYSVPEVVQPNETAFITEGTTLNGETTTDNYGETSFNFTFRESDKESNLMEVSAIKGIASDYDYSVTGLVKNPTDQQQSDVRIVAILFDSNGEILGGLSGSVDVGLAAGGEAGFELSYPPLPDNIGSKVSKIEVKSYGFTW